MKFLKKVTGRKKVSKENRKEWKKRGILRKLNGAKRLQY